MTITFKDEFDVAGLQKAWKEIDAPAYLRATNKPNIYSVIPRKGFSSEVVNFFLIDQLYDEESRKRMEKKMYKILFNRQIQEIEQQRKCWNDKLEELEKSEQ